MHSFPRPSAKACGVAARRGQWRIESPRTENGWAQDKQLESQQSLCLEALGAPDKAMLDVHMTRVAQSRSISGAALAASICRTNAQSAIMLIAMRFCVDLGRMPFMRCVYHEIARGRSLEVRVIGGPRAGAHHMLVRPATRLGISKGRKP